MMSGASTEAPESSVPRAATLAVGTAHAYRRASRGRSLVLGLVGLLLLCSLCVDVAIGPGGFSLGQVLSVLAEPDALGPQLRVIVWELRLPIALLAILVGAMLGAAGAEMQTILNNPLAEPFTLGISSAAAFGAALAIVLGVEVLPVGGEALVTINAFVFALATAWVLYLFARLRGATSETMVLIGIALLFTFNALLSLLQYTASDVQLMQIVFWMMGSLSRASWDKLAVCALVLALVLPYFLYRGWALTALRLGDERAASLGVDPRRLRLVVLFGVTLLAATAVSFVGTIAFVGLVGPHIARMTVGEDQRFFLPLSILVGALMMSLTSIASKSITPGVIYPVGIITSLIGIPFFVMLILSVRRRGWQ
jgi:iron complex transport system permease protein